VRKKGSRRSGNRGQGDVRISSQDIHEAGLKPSPSHRGLSLSVSVFFISVLDDLLICLFFYYPSLPHLNANSMRVEILSLLNWYNFRV
jgi:hypothetical protein